MKIELKHLAPYLPYGLKVVTQYGLDVPKGGHIFEICGICERPDMAWKKGEIGLFFTRLGQNREMSNEYFEFRPALKPLSDLTKEIEHNGEKFVPLYELCKTQGFNMLPIGNWEYSYSNEFNCNTSMMKNKAWIFRFIGKDNSFFLNGICEWTEKHQKTRRHIEMVQKLFEWHFDVFGLIPQNLAIDINTLK